jgi:putative two-component system response regulator
LTNNHPESGQPSEHCFDLNQLAQRLLVYSVDEVFACATRRARTNFSEANGSLGEVLTLVEDVRAHGTRTARMARAIGAQLGLPPADLPLLEVTATVHDVGKLLVDPQTLRACGILTGYETQAMRSHVAFGRELVDEAFFSQADVTARVAEAALLHHERWDGLGYPCGLRGAEIPLLARIVSVADVFDALVSERSYKPAWPVERAVEEIRGGRGSRFDPDCVDAFEASFAPMVAL